MSFLDIWLAGEWTDGVSVSPSPAVISTVSVTPLATIDTTVGATATPAVIARPLVISAPTISDSEVVAVANLARPLVVSQPTVLTGIRVTVTTIARPISLAGTQAGIGTIVPATTVPVLTYLVTPAGVVSAAPREYWGMIDIGGPIETINPLDYPFSGVFPGPTNYPGV